MNSTPQSTPAAPRELRSRGHLDEVKLEAAQLFGGITLGLVKNVIVMLSPIGVAALTFMWVNSAVGGQLWGMADVALGVIVALFTLLMLVVGIRMYWGKQKFIIMNQLEDKSELRIFMAGFENWILRHGSLARGKIVRSHDPATVRFQTPLTRSTFTISAKAHDAIIEDGGFVDVLYDPRHPENAIVVQLMGLEFESRPVEDRRPEMLPAPSNKMVFGATERWTLFNGPNRREDSLKQRFVMEFLFGYLAGMPLGAQEKGEVVMDGAHLSMRESQHVQLDAPLHLNLSFWPVTTEMGELNVSLRQRGADPRALSLEFKVRLPQACVDASLPLKHEALPYLMLEDFKALWPSLRAAALSSGDDDPGIRVQP